MPNKPDRFAWAKTTSGRLVLITATLWLLFLFGTGALLPEPEEPKDVAISEVVTEVREGNVIKAVLDDNTNSIVVTLREEADENTGVSKDKDRASNSDTDRPRTQDSETTEPTSSKNDSSEDDPADGADTAEEDEKVSFEPDAEPEGPQLRADYPISYSDTLTQVLIKYDIPTKTIPVPVQSTLTRFIYGLIPILLIIGVLIYFMRSYAGNIGRFSGGRGQQIGEVPTTRFSDVAGCEEAVTELQELVEFFNDAERFTAVGAKAPRGALLVGPPGTGKTLLARAVAGEAGVPFFPIAGSDFVETFVGVGAKRVRDLFDKARKAGSAIIFIDEIDAVGRSRSAGPQQGGDSERENTLVSMLNEMDGFDDGHRIIVLAATNRADVLDGALTRPGRLDRQIQVPAPDRRGREQILKVHSRGRAIAEGIDYTSLARRTPGMSGADLEQLVNEACMEAGRRGLTLVDQDSFDAAIATVALGRARTSALVTDNDRTITAWHEAGHTVAALMLPAADDPVSVSIIPRGPAGGVTWMSGSDDVFLTRDKALAQLRVAMGGRAAEEILLDGSFTQGAHGDLTSASNLAWAMVTKYGMSAAGYLVLPDETLQMGGVVGDRARGAAEELLSAAHCDAQQLLARYRELLEAIAIALLDVETLSKAEILALAAATPGLHHADLELRDQEPTPLEAPAAATRFELRDLPAPAGEPVEVPDADEQDAVTGSDMPAQAADDSLHPHETPAGPTAPAQEVRGKHAKDSRVLRRLLGRR